MNTIVVHGIVDNESVVYGVIETAYPDTLRVLSKIRKELKKIQDNTNPDIFASPLVKLDSFKKAVDRIGDPKIRVLSDPVLLSDEDVFSNL